MILPLRWGSEDGKRGITKRFGKREERKNEGKKRCGNTYGGKNF